MNYNVGQRVKFMDGYWSVKAEVVAVVKSAQGGNNDMVTVRLEDGTRTTKIASSLSLA